MRGHSAGHLETQKEEGKRQRLENWAEIYPLLLNRMFLSQRGSWSHNLWFALLDFLDEIDSVEASMWTPIHSNYCFPPGSPMQQYPALVQANTAWPLHCSWSSQNDYEPLFPLLRSDRVRVLISLDDATIAKEQKEPPSLHLLTRNTS